MYARFRYSGKNPMRYAVFWPISVRFCGFRTSLTPPSYRSRRGLTYLFVMAIGKSPLSALSFNFDFQEITLIVGYHNKSWHWREKKLYRSKFIPHVTSCAEDFILFIVAIYLFVTFGVMLEKYICCGTGCRYSTNFSVGD